MHNKENGVNGTFKILGWIGGAFGFALLIYTTFHTPLVRAISNEVNDRKADTADIRKEVAEKLSIIADKQSSDAVTLARIATAVEYLKDTSRKCQ